MVGLFGFAEGINVVITNLGLINPVVEAAEGYQQIGALVGLFKDGKLQILRKHVPQLQSSLW